MSENNPSLDLWYQERHNDEISLGLKVTKTLYSKQSEFQRVDIFETPGFGRVMTLDGLMMVTERDEFVYHEMIAHVAMCTHPNPKDVLIIGGGDGGTLREIVKHSKLNSVTLCEIDGDVVSSAKEFLPFVANQLGHKKAKVIIDDGVKFVQDSQPNSYDIIIVDSTDPIGPGVGLFSESFYKNVNRILRSGGIVMAQAESPWEQNIDLRKVYNNLKVGIGKVYSMCGPVPTYPYGFWSWAFASKDLSPLSFDRQLSAEVAKVCRHYHPAMHAGAFLTVPKHMLDKLEGVVANHELSF